jgi:two-component system phosphate regulon response regulator PhoB
VHIRAIRRKLEDRAEVIETVRGVGYRFRDVPAWQESS